MISKFRLSILFIIVTSAVVAPTQLGGGDKLDHVRENRPRQPNILFLFPDQWRFDWDGGNDHGTDILPLDLPNVKFIKSQGVRFTHAYVPSPLCAPGRASLASGREYDYCGVLTNTQNDYDISIPTFYSLLRDVGGYHTMTTGKDDLTKASQLGTKDGFGGNWTGTYHQRELVRIIVMLVLCFFFNYNGI